MADTNVDLPDPELGTATIVYEGHDGTETIEVDNEAIAYFDDHWQVKTGEDEEGNDVIRRLPRERVHYVERSVEEFKDRIDTLVDRAKGSLERFDLG